MAHASKGEPHDPPTRSHARNPARTPARTAGRRADSARRRQPDARHHGALQSQGVVALADPDGRRSRRLVQLRHAGQRRAGTAPSAFCRGCSIRASARCFRRCPDAGTASFSSKTSRRTGLCWAGRLPTASCVVTWSFMLVEIDENTTRLIVRARASDDYRFHGLPKAMGLLLARMVHFVMERKQLLEIARRAERRAEARRRHEHDETTH